jgi:hypothetical protein
MSDKLPENTQNEEVDLGQLFKAIGNLFDRFYRFIRSILKSILSVIVYALKAIIDNFKLIATVMIVLAVVGFVVEKYKPKVYTSSMLVKPYFDTKYHMINNISYYDALLHNNEYEKLSSIFNVHKDTLKKIKSFEVELAFESESNQLLRYENFLKSIDSSIARKFSFKDFIKNEEISSGREFEIIVESYKKDIFIDLKEGINASFANEYSINKKKKRDSLNFLKRQSILAAIEEIDSLQRVYIDVLEEDSKSQTTALTLGEGLALDSDQSKTREYELLDKEIQLRDQLSKLEEKKVEEDVFFDVVSDFQAIGESKKEITDWYSIIFPLIGFSLMCLVFLISRLVEFVKNYEE